MSVLEHITATDSIVILTGAGISKESGLATFRDPDGIWAKHRIEDVAHGGLDGAGVVALPVGQAIQRGLEVGRVGIQSVDHGCTGKV